MQLWSDSWFEVEVSAVIQKFFAYNSHLSKLILNNSCWTHMEVLMFYVIKQYAGNNGLWIQKTYQIIAFFGKKNIFSNSNYCEVLVAGPITAEITTACDSYHFQDRTFQTFCFLSIEIPCCQLTISYNWIWYRITALQKGFISSDISTQLI